MTKASGQRRARAEQARLVAAAAQFARAGQYGKAVAPLVEAVRVEPDSAELANDLGVALLHARRIPEAISWLRRSISLRPNLGSTYYNLGLALQQVQDEDGAIGVLRHGIMLSPDHAEAHARLGDLLSDRGTRAEAVLEYERACALAPDTAVGHLCKAMILGADDRYDDAVLELRRSIEHGGSDDRLHVRLGQFLQQAGRFEEAIASFETSIEIAPWQEDAYYGLVSSKKLTEADRPWIARILARLEAKEWDKLFSPAMAERKRMMLHFALGKALDDLGEYAEAMKHFHAANEVGRKHGSFDRAAHEERVEAILARYTRELFAQSSAVGSPDETPILIVGMPRSGTTLAERVLSSHPLVRGRGELDFWGLRGPTWAFADPDALAKAADTLRGDYLAILRRGAPDAVRVTDKMPFNFLWVGLVHLLLPNARFVHCRRNPVGTCWSIQTTPILATRFLPRRLDELAGYYRTYRRLADHWRQIIPSDRWLDVDYEDVVADREKAARRLVDFAGLAWDAACLRPEENRDAVRTASQWQVRQPIYTSSVERWRRYEPWVGELKELL